VEPTNGQPDTRERCELSANRALHAYRERRRRRRGEDTYHGSEDALLGRAEEGIGERERERRRADILADAEEEGMPPELAELLYDVAREEGLDPGLGYELVRTGLGVAPPSDGISNAPDQPMTDKYLPAWMFPAEPTDRLLRERMLRISFRRLRSMLEEEDDLDEAFRRFANEPDVGHYGY
jgi:hypothetical protein